MNSLLTHRLAARFFRHAALAHAARPTLRFRPRLEMLEDRLTPAVLVWQGDLSANWNDGVATVNTNWSGNRLPQAGDTLTFDNTAVGNFTNFNDTPADTAYEIINIAGSGYDITGNAIALNNQLRTTAATSGTNTVALDIRLNSASNFATLTGTLGSSTLVLSGTIDLNGNVLFVNNDSNTFRLTGRITGAGSALGAIRLLPNSQATLGGNSDFTGTTTVDPGARLQLTHGNALGAAGAGNGTTIQIDGLLQLDGGITVPEALITTGNGPGGTTGTTSAVFNNTGNNTLTGPLTSGGIGTSFGINAGTQLSLNGAISGAGGLFRFASMGSGTLVLGGTQPNTYLGNTIVQANNSKLVLNKPAGVNAIPGGTLTAGVNSNGANTYEVQLLADDQIADTTTLTLNFDGIFNLNDHSERIGTLASPIVSANGRIDVGAGRFTLDRTLGGFDGQLAGAGQFVVVSSVSLGGNSAGFTGATHVQGFLGVNGILSNSSITLAGGTLGGNGTVGRILVDPALGGFILPGNSPDTLTSAATAFTSTLNSLTTLVFELLEPVPGSFDVLNVLGVLDLGNALLEIKDLFTSAQPGDTFTIITSLFPIVGSFANSIVNSGTKTFRVDVQGDEVVVTNVTGGVVVPPPPPDGGDNVGGQDGRNDETGIEASQVLDKDEDEEEADSGSQADGSDQTGDTAEQATEGAGLNGSEAISESSSGPGGQGEVSNETLVDAIAEFLSGPFKGTGGQFSDNKGTFNLGDASALQAPIKGNEGEVNPVKAIVNQADLNPMAPAEANQDEDDQDSEPQANRGSPFADDRDDWLHILAGALAVGHGTASRWASAPAAGNSRRTGGRQPPENHS